jgi:hypothetical protein
MTSMSYWLLPEAKAMIVMFLMICIIPTNAPNAFI